MRVLGDRLQLGFELPPGVTLTATLPALERPCSELDPNIKHMVTDKVPWCELRQRMLLPAPEIALFDDNDRTQIGSVRVEVPTGVAVLEEKGKRAKITRETAPGRPHEDQPVG